MTVARSSSPALSERWGRPLVAVAGAALLAPTLLRPWSDGPVVCPLRRVTGVWCPTCGMTRALGWLAHGDFHESLRYHPLAPVLVIEIVLVGAFWLYQRRHDPSWAARSPAVFRGLLVANALLALVVWVVRLKLGSFDHLG
jgi:hypothetical protein